MAALGESTWRGLDNPIRIAIEAKSLKCLQRGDTAASLQLFLAAQADATAATSSETELRAVRHNLAQLGTRRSTRPSV